MQKLLIHINILLAFTVLFCSHSAYGQGVYIDDSSSPAYGADPRAVDLGSQFNVYWASRNVGASGSTDPGRYFQWSSTQNWSDSNWQNWRIPSKDEVNNLINQCTYSFESDGVKITTNTTGKSILIPKSSFKDLGNYQDMYKNLSYFWTSTDSEYRGNRAYRFQGGKFTSVIKPFLVSDRASAEARSYLKDSELPLRPVIDKVTITVTTAGGNTITKTYPIGTKVQLGAFWDDCHITDHWETNTNETINEACPEVTITSNITYIAYFAVKTTTLEATTKDDRKGVVGLKVGDEIE